jgi:hypothetical protein
MESLLGKSNMQPVRSARYERVKFPDKRVTR